MEPFEGIRREYASGGGNNPDAIAQAANSLIFTIFTKSCCHQTPASRQREPALASTRITTARTRISHPWSARATTTGEKGG